MCWPSTIAPAILALPLIVCKKRNKDCGKLPSSGRCCQVRKACSICGSMSRPSSRNTGIKSASSSSLSTIAGSAAASFWSANVCVTMAGLSELIGSSAGSSVDSGCDCGATSTTGMRCGSGPSSATNSDSGATSAAMSIVVSSRTGSLGAAKKSLNLAAERVSISCSRRTSISTWCGS